MNWLDGWAIRRLNRRARIEDGQGAVLCGVSPPDGWWYTPQPGLRTPEAVIGKAPTPVTEWSLRRLNKWLRDHPAPQPTESGGPP
jgi:hypothetical protein